MVPPWFTEWLTQVILGDSQADVPVTRAILERERSYATNQALRTGPMLARGDREFGEIIGLCKKVLSSTTSSQSGNASTRALPPPPTLPPGPS